MRAAIYARKSTEQHGVADEQKSVARQVEHARQFAATKGWTVADEHVYVDDGISGAEFAARPGFLRLMNALKPRPPFHVLIMSEESRLGREQIEVSYALKQLVTSGVRVFCYLTGAERTLDNAIDKAMLALQSMADEMEREKARQRTYDALQRKARAGHVTGGRVFGFDNVDVTTNGQRSHVERQVNQAEAVVVRRIFEECARGQGLTSITKMLNAEGVLTPRPQQGRPSGWVASSVREVLRRPLYKGEIVWNQTRKRDRWGQQHPQARPESDWLHIQAPELRIVSDALWNAAHAQMAERHKQYAGGSRAQWGSHYLLSGFAKCAACGGGFASQLRTHGSKGSRHQVAFYACTSHWKRGPEVCQNSLVGRMERMNAAVLTTLRDDILHPAVVERAIELALAELSPARLTERRDELADALMVVEADCRRLGEAIAQGGSLDVLMGELRACQTRRDDLRSQQRQSSASPAFRYGQVANTEHLTRRLRNHLAHWRELLTGDVEAARDVLRQLVVEPFRFTPVVEDGRRGYQFRGVLALDRVVSGVIDLPEDNTHQTGVPNGFRRQCVFPLNVAGYADLLAA